MSPKDNTITTITSISQINDSGSYVCKCTNLGLPEIYSGETMYILARKTSSTSIYLIGWVGYGSVIYTTALTNSGGSWAISVPWNKKLNSGDANFYTHPSYNAYNKGLYNITVNSLGHITGATAVTKQDILNLGITEGSNITVETSQCTAWSATLADNYCKRFGKVAVVMCSGTYGSGQDIPKNTSLFSLPWAMDRESDYDLRGELILRPRNLTDTTRHIIADGYYNHQYMVIGSNETFTGYVEFTFRMIYITK